MKARLLALLCLCAAGLRAQEARDRTVVLVSIDGLPAAALQDPRLPAPTLRRLAREGAAARALRPVNPSVTWPNHTSMVTGVPPARHHVLFNGLLVRPGPGLPVRVEPWRDKAEMVRAPTVYDLAYRAGLTTAQVDWVAIQNPGTITWEFAERPNPGGVIEREMIAAGLIAENDVAEFGRGSGPWRDRQWTNAATHIIRRHTPNLLLFHLLNLDSIHHRYGPGSPAGATGIAFADDRVREILDALKDAGRLERSTVLVVSDHGFQNVRRVVHPNVALRQAGLIRTAGGRLACDAWAVPEGGTALVYITDPANRARLAPQVREILGKLEGVARVIEPEDFAALGLPKPAETDQAPDLVLAAAEGHAFGGGHEGAPVTGQAEGGSHGYLSSDPAMEAVFIAWGYGIQPGARLDVVDNVDLAPTIAALLGLRLGGVAGKPAALR